MPRSGEEGLGMRSECVALRTECVYLKHLILGDEMLLQGFQVTCLQI